MTSTGGMSFLEEITAVLAVVLIVLILKLKGMKKSNKRTLKEGGKEK